MAISIIIGFLLIYLVSDFLFKKTNYENLLITLFCIASPVPFLAYTQAILIKPYLYGIFIFVILLKLYRLIINFRKKGFQLSIDLKKTKKIFLKRILHKWIIISLSFVFTLALTYKTFPNIWRFEAHDLLYYSWLNEIFILDYYGPVRIPTAYPNIFSANHLISGSLLSPFLILNKNVNMFNTYSIKYLLCFSSIFNFIFVYLNSFFKEFKPLIFLNRIFPIFVFISLFLFYSSELDYSMAISNFPLILVILTFSSFLYKKNHENYIWNEKEDNLITIFFAYCLLITKATTFPILLLSYIIFIITNYSKRFKIFFKEIPKKYIFLLFIFVLINFLSWILPESNHGSLQASSPLCLINSSDPIEILKCTYNFFENPFTGWYVPSLKINFLNLSSLGLLIKEFYFIWIICLLPCFISGIILQNQSNFKINQLYGKYLTSYALATSFGIVFIRESIGFNGSHTFHSSVIAPLFTITALIILYREKYKKININSFTNIFYVSLLFLLFLVNFYDHSVLSNRIEPFINLENTKNRPILSITNFESNQFTTSGCTNNKKLKKYFGNHLDNKGCANKKNNIPEIKAALEGKRTNASLNSNYSIIKQWVLINE